MDPLLSDVLGLLEIRSVGGSAAEIEAQRWVAGTLRGWGWDVETWVDDPAGVRSAGDHPGMEVPRDRVMGVIGGPPGSTGTRLILGHTDVVPGGPPPRLESGRIVGRGAVDMKAGLVAGMYAARSAPAHCAVCVVSGEEDGGIGAYLALRHGLTARQCVIPEPTDLAIVAANAGSLTFRIVLPGVAAHGARRWDGHNAIDAVPDVLERLRDLEGRRNRDVPGLLAGWPIAYPISVGRIRGGDWPSTVMAEVELEGRYGVALGESLDSATRAFEAALTGTGARVEWFGGRFAPTAVAVDDPLVRSLASAHRTIHAADPPITGTTYGSDMRQLVGAGIPTVLYGPGDAALAHGEDEEVAVDQVLACREVLARWLSA